MTRPSHSAAHAATNDGDRAAKITRFNFEGDALDVVPLPDGDVGVSLKRLCEAVPVDADAQAKRLARTAKRGARWACTVKMNVHDETGRVQEMLLLPRRSIPMFAATISLNAVREDRRPGAALKLARIHDQCAEVLADHFLGKRGDGQMTVVLTRMASAIEGLAASSALLSRRLDIVEARISSAALPANDGEGIGPAAAERHILRPLRKIARLKAAAIRNANDPSALRRLRLTEERSLRRELNYQMDKRQAWAKFPPERLTEAKNAIERIVGMAEDLARLAGVVSNDTSGPLFAKVADPRTVN